MPIILARLSQPTEVYTAGTVIILVSTVQVLRLRTNLQQVHKVKYLAPMNGTYGHTEANLAIITYRYRSLTIFHQELMSAFTVA